MSVDRPSAGTALWRRLALGAGPLKRGSDRLQFLARARSLRRGDAEPDSVSIRNQVGLDSDRREHERSLLGVGKRAEPIDLDQVGHGLIRDVIGGAWDLSRRSDLEDPQSAALRIDRGRSARSIATRR